jgi:hypothetical protein
MQWPFVIVRLISASSLFWRPQPDVKHSTLHSFDAVGSSGKTNIITENLLLKEVASDILRPVWEDRDGISLETIFSKEIWSNDTDQQNVWRMHRLWYFWIFLYFRGELTNKWIQFNVKINFLSLWNSQKTGFHKTTRLNDSYFRAGFAWNDV